MHNILASIFSAPSCSYYKYDNENMIRFFCLISLCMKEQGSSISAQSMIIERLYAKTCITRAPDTVDKVCQS